MNKTQKNTLVILCVIFLGCSNYLSYKTGHKFGILDGHYNGFTSGVTEAWASYHQSIEPIWLDVLKALNICRATLNQKGA